jgi:hypothetical protein
MLRVEGVKDVVVVRAPRCKLVKHHDFGILCLQDLPRSQDLSLDTCQALTAREISLLLADPKVVVNKVVLVLLSNDGRVAHLREESS